MTANGPLQGALVRDALFALVVGLGAALFVARGATGLGLAVAAVVAAAALVLAIAWATARRPWLFGLTAAAAALVLATPLTEPVLGLDRALVGVAALGVVGFVEHASLAERTREHEGSQEAAGVAVRALRGRVRRIMLTTTFLLGVVLFLPAMAAGVFPGPFAESVELASGWGVLALSLLVGLVLVSLARWRAARAT